MVQGYTDCMMTKILFLEGPIQTGKSTLIRACLGDHLSECGGFTSQRLIGPDGNTRGFRLCPASAPLTAPAEGIADEDIAGEGFADGVFKYFRADGVFKYFRPEGPAYQDQQVFDRLGVQLLEASKNTPLILLDEVGGSELLREPFRKKLDEVLGSGVPCLGVLKLYENARRLERSYQDAPIARANLELRRHITEDLGGTVLYYDRLGDPAGAAAAADAVGQFVHSIF